MAKIVYAPTVSGIIGTVGTGVYYRSGSAKFGFLRNWVQPDASTSTAERGSWISNLSKIWQEHVIAAGKADFAAYGQLYKNLPVYGDDLARRTASGFAIWYKALYNWSIDLGTIDLSTVTIEDLALYNSTIGKISLLVENGYLPSVEGYGDFQEQWIPEV